MKITKLYIQENLINKKGYLNANYYKMVKETKEELYLIYKNIEEPKCSGNNPTKFKSFTKGYLKVCGDMTCQCYKDRYKRTQETLKKTNLKRYGVECTFAAKKCREKGDNTKIEKYGSLNNIEKGIKTNRENGTYEINHIKAKVTSLEKYGDATYRNIKSQKETKLERYGSETYNNPEKAQPKRRKTLEDKGSWIPLDQVSDWELYKRIVRKITEDNYKLNKETINPNNFTRVLNGEEGHQLDHIISVQEGFLNNIPSYIIGDKNNLQMLSWEDNRTKWH